VIALQIRMGTPVRGIDGLIGELADVVMLPAERRLTHVVVVPRFHQSQARLVPFELIGDSDRGAGIIELRCTIAAFGDLPTIQAYATLRLMHDPGPVVRGPSVVGILRECVLPSVLPGSLQMDALDDDPHVSVTYDRIPSGEVEVQHRSEVTGADGAWIGYFDGLTVDGKGAIEEVLVEHGHIRSDEPVRVPTSGVAELAMDGLRLALTRSELDALVLVDNAGAR
jgi:hypothetical protein